MDMYEIVKKLVGKCIPMKPHRTDRNIPYCECGNKLKSYEQYCDQCGQKLDWSGYF